MTLLEDKELVAILQAAGEAAKPRFRLSQLYWDDDPHEFGCSANTRAWGELDIAADHCEDKGRGWAANGLRKMTTLGLLPAYFQCYSAGVERSVNGRPLPDEVFWAWMPHSSTKAAGCRVTNRMANGLKKYGGGYHPVSLDKRNLQGIPVGHWDYRVIRFSTFEAAVVLMAGVLHPLTNVESMVYKVVKDLRAKRADPVFSELSEVAAADRVKKEQK